MAEPAETTIREGFGAESRVGTLGLDLGLLVEVVRRGEVERGEATNYDPKTASGTNAYNRRVRAKREAFCIQPYNWRAATVVGVELIVAPDNRRAVFTRGGNSAVGLRDRRPQPKGEIGEGQSAILDSSLPLFESKWLEAQGLPWPDYEAWMLLVYASKFVIRSELSLGSPPDEKGHVGRWFERIILPELDPNDLVPGKHIISEPDEGAFDVPIIRKKA
jgi:hypothetical protein